MKEKIVLNITENTKQPKEIMTPDEIAEFFGVTRKTIYTWINKEGMPSFKVGSNRRFIIKDCIEWLRTKSN